MQLDGLHHDYYAIAKQNIMLDDLHPRQTIILVVLPHNCYATHDKPLCLMTSLNDKPFCLKASTIPNYDYRLRLV
eukprot:6876500-Heterocapsa_arctica.AAC.1